MHFQDNPWSKGLVYLTFTQRASQKLSTLKRLYSANMA